MTVIARYFRRRGLRWAIWMARVGVISWGAVGFGALLEWHPNGWSVAAVIGMYAIYMAGELVRAAKPVNVIQIKPSHMEMVDGVFSLVSSDLDKAVERLIERSAKEQKS